MNIFHQAGKFKKSASKIPTLTNLFDLLLFFFVHPFFSPKTCLKLIGTLIGKIRELTAETVLTSV